MALDVRIGVNPVLWMNDDLPALGGETPLARMLDEGRRAGYRGFELGHAFPRDAAAVRALLAPRGLACVGGWWSGRLAGRGLGDELAEVDAFARLLVECGGEVLVYGEVHGSIQGRREVALFRRPRLPGPDWAPYGERLTALARHLAARGLALAYHPHMGALVQTEEDVDRLVAVTGPEVGLVLDTGHAAFAGADPVALARRHAARVRHVHCKDLRPGVARLAQNRAWSFLTAVLNGVFTVPGEGAVDFRGVLRALDGYRGWLVVEAEQDPAVAPSAACAERGLRHLQELLGAMGADGRAMQGERV